MEEINKITISNQQSNLQIIKSVSSNVVSSLSSGMFSYGLGFMLLHNTHSPLSFGLDVAISPIIGLLFFIPIGNYVDHHRHKHILIGSYILRMILLSMFSITLPMFSGVIQLFPVAVFISLDAILSNFRTTTYSASIHELVNDDRISVLNSLTQAASAGSQVLSPLLGVVLYNLVSIEVFMGIEIMATMISFLIMLTMHFFGREPAKASNHKQYQFDGFKETLAYIKKRKLLGDIVVLAVFLNLLATIFTIGLPFIVVSELDFPNHVVSYLDMAFSMGIIAGSIGAGVFQKRLKFTTKIFIPLFIVALGTMGLGWLLNSRSMLIVIVGGIILMLVLAIAIALMNVSIQVRIQSTTPTQILGRVTSTLTTACTATMPLGIIGYTLLFKFIKQGAMIFVGSGTLMFIYTIWCISLFEKDFQIENEYLKQNS